MTQAQAGSVLRRLVSTGTPAGPTEADLSSTRVLRLASVRAAERGAGLAINVLSVAEGTEPLDDLLVRLDAEMMILGLWDGTRLVGGVGIDLELRTALIEAQTIGHLRLQPAEPRPVTATDAAMAQPLVAALVAELAKVPPGGVLSDWIGAYRVEPRALDPKVLQSAMADGSYRLARMTVDFGAASRQGQLWLFARLAGQDRPAVAPDRADAFRSALQGRVLTARSELTAVLHRCKLSLSAVDSLHVGQIIPLPGISVGSVTLEGAEGRIVARGRLGQSLGLRAVRVESGRAGQGLAGPSMTETGLVPVSGGPAGA